MLPLELSECLEGASHEAITVATSEPGAFRVWSRGYHRYDLYWCLYCRYRPFRVASSTRGGAALMSTSLSSWSARRRTGLQGPEIRSGFFADGKKKIDVVRGQELELVTDYEFLGDSTKVRAVVECSHKVDGRSGLSKVYASS